MVERDAVTNEVMKYYGYGTNWIWMYLLFPRFYRTAASHKPQPWTYDKELYSCDIGAVGTAKAKVYVMQQLGLRSVHDNYDYY